MNESVSLQRIYNVVYVCMLFMKAVAKLSVQRECSLCYFAGYLHSGSRRKSLQSLSLCLC